MKRRENLPKEFSQHLQPMAADVFDDLGPCFTIMTASALEAELQAILEALPDRAGTMGPRAVSAQEGWDLAMAFEEACPAVQPCTPGQMRETLALLPPSKISTLAVRLEEIRRKIRFATLCQGRDFDPTDTLLVPALWRSRWEMLLQGTLLPAWIAHLTIGEPG